MGQKLGEIFGGNFLGKFLGEIFGVRKKGKFLVKFDFCQQEVFPLYYCPERSEVTLYEKTFGYH